MSQNPPKTLLRWPGNKSKLLPDLLRLMPRKPISLFLEFFTGSGVVTFSMVNRCKKVMSNDYDKDIYNLWNVLKDEELSRTLEDALSITPGHDAIFQEWKTQEEADPVWQAVRFLYLCNFSLYGQRDTLRHEASGNDKPILMQRLAAIKDILRTSNIDFLCCDFRDVLDRISYRKKDFGRAAHGKAGWVGYLDPPYLHTEKIYKDRACVWTEQDTLDALDLVSGADFDMMMSEFKQEFVMDEAKSRGLVITEIGERRNIKNRNIEILITNYQPQRDQLSFFGA